MPRARFPNIWGVRTQGSSDTSSGLGCAKHARQQHAHALGPLRAASCERCRACHPHRRYFVHLTLRRTYVVVSVYWCTVGGAWGALSLSTPPTQEECNYHPSVIRASRRSGQPTPAPSEHNRPVEPSAADEARVESDALIANEPVVTTATAQEAPEHAVGDSPAPMQVCVSAAQDSQVESTGRSLNGRRGPGLKPFDPEERKAQKRRDGARDARPNTRWDR